jgi:hypothetical protein
MTSLPENVMLVTFLRCRSGSFLVQLGNQYSVAEDPALYAAVEDDDLDLALLFKGFAIKSILELTLSVNQKYQNWVDRRMDWTGTGALPLLSTVRAFGSRRGGGNYLRYTSRYRQFREVRSRTLLLPARLA